MIYVSYTRVSCGRQAADGQSLEAQAAAIAAWAAAGGHECLGQFSDAGLSGRDDSRPGIQEAVRVACRHRAALVVSSITRFARSIRVALALGDRLTRGGARLVSLNESIDTDSPTGRLVWVLLNAVSAWEAEVIAERTTQVLDHMRRRRLRISGHAPLGWRVGDGAELIAVPEEQAIVADMLAWRRSGWSYAKIAAHLSATRATKRGCSTWRPSCVRRIITREMRLADHTAA